MGKTKQDFLYTLLKRFLITLSIILVLRTGTLLPVPGIDLLTLNVYLQTHPAAANFISTFSGNEPTFAIGLFTLNIFPYISATVASQFLIAFVPSLSKMQKEGDMESQRTIQLLIRFLTLNLAIFEGVGIATYLQNVLLDWSWMLASEIVLWLTAGAMIVLWLSELITTYGIGNGSSLLIYINIISNLPNFTEKIILENTGSLSTFSILVIVLVISLSLMGIVFLQTTIRSIPLVSSKQLNQNSSQKKEYSYLPLRYNSAGVMPIILTTTSLVLPTYLRQFEVFSSFTFGLKLDPSNFLYWILYFGLIVFFSSYSATFVLKPKDLSEQLQKMAVVIPNVKPGKATTFYLKQVIKRINLIGGILLAILVVFPNFIISKVSLGSLNGLGTSSLLILAGVLLDIYREIENMYYTSIYDDKY